MNYKLNVKESQDQKGSLLAGLKKLGPLLINEKKNIIVAFVSILITSSSTLLAPVIISNAVDAYMQHKNFSGVLFSAGILFIIFAIGLVANYTQIISMGTVGRNILFKLRNSIFLKLQELPIAFFNQNKAGDLISRINNDTDKLNQFFSQALMQFAGNFFLIVGAGILILVINIKLGLAALIPALLVVMVTQIISAWVKRKNFKSLQSLGGMSAEIQESLANFKVIAAFNRLDYFRNKFNEANENNYSASIGAGIANNVFTPIYGLASNLAQLIVLGYGIFLIFSGNFTVGLLIGFLLYVNNFYTPLRQIASVWQSLQLALAGLDRVSEVLNLENDMVITPSLAESENPSPILELKNVYFRYPDSDEDVLKNISLRLEKGKTYALVGPTGGGKTTTASLMARLYDPLNGVVFLDGKDIRSYQHSERVKKIGFILQEPFLFNGTVGENILYGNDEYKGYSEEKLTYLLEQANLLNLLERFPQGLSTSVTASGNTVSLGQKQLIAFIRAVLRKPELLILDEATANIDTVTEQLLDDILNKLPAETTKIIIAHRLNTIDNADEIYFVNSGEVTLAGSMQDAVNMLLHKKRKS